MKSTISRRTLLDAGASAAGLLLASCAAPAAAEPQNPKNPSNQKSQKTSSPPASRARRRNLPAAGRAGAPMRER